MPARDLSQKYIDHLSITSTADTWGPEGRFIHALRARPVEEMYSRRWLCVRTKWRPWLPSRSHRGYFFIVREHSLLGENDGFATFGFETAIGCGWRVSLSGAAGKGGLGGLGRARCSVGEQPAEVHCVYDDLPTCPNPPCLSGTLGAKREKENQLIMIHSA